MPRQSRASGCRRGRAARKQQLRSRCGARASSRRSAAGAARSAYRGARPSSRSTAVAVLCASSCIRASSRRRRCSRRASRPSRSRSTQTLARARVFPFSLFVERHNALSRASRADLGEERSAQTCVGRLALRVRALRRRALREWGRRGAPRGDGRSRHARRRRQSVRARPRRRPRLRLRHAHSRARPAKRRTQRHSLQYISHGRRRRCMRGGGVRGESRALFRANARLRSKRGTLSDDDEDAGGRRSGSNGRGSPPRAPTPNRRRAGRTATSSRSRLRRTLRNAAKERERRF